MNLLYYWILDIFNKSSTYLYTYIYKKIINYDLTISPSDRFNT